MNILNIVLILLLPVCLILHGLFVLLSSALLHARLKKIEDEEFEISFGRKTAVKFLQSPVKNSLSMQAGRFISFVVLVLLLVKLLPLGKEVVFALALLCIITALVLVQIAWAISYEEPEKAVCYCGPFLVPFVYLLSPLGQIAYLIGDKFTRRYDFDSPVESQQSLSIDEIAEIVDYNEDHAEDEDELSMLRGVVELADTQVTEIMTPRQDIDYISDTMSIEEAVSFILQSEHSRLPVVGESLDDLKGLLIVRDLNSLIGQNLSSKTLKEFIRPVMKTDGEENLLGLLGRFREENSHMAIVIDEHGGVDGLITLEDILEEVVGDIFDEHDSLEEGNQQTLSGDLLVDGSSLIYNLNEEYDLNLPEGEYDTVAGFIIDQLGKIPDAGEIITYNGYKLIVEDLADNRINQVRVVVKNGTDLASI